MKSPQNMMHSSTRTLDRDDVILLTHNGMETYDLNILSPTFLRRKLFFFRFMTGKEGKIWLDQDQSTDNTTLK